MKQSDAKQIRQDYERALSKQICDLADNLSNEASIRLLAKVAAHNNLKDAETYCRMLAMTVLQEKDE